MTDGEQDKKDEWWEFLRRESNEAVEELGLGPDALPDRDDEQQ